MRRIVAALALALVLLGCAPYPAAPTGNWDTDLCKRVRAWVYEGMLPLEQAVQWYGKCGPFEVKP